MGWMMHRNSGKLGHIFVREASAAALLAGLLTALPAAAQTASADQAVEEPDNGNDIVVTGSRIQRDGFDQPTPTTVLGATEFRQAAAVNLHQALNELPQIRNPVPANQSERKNAGAGRRVATRLEPGGPRLVTKKTHT